MISIGKHTVRCPKCNSDEYLQESKMTFPTGAKATIKTCCECGQTYIVTDDKPDKGSKCFADIVGAFAGYVFIGFTATISLAMLYIMYIILRWIWIGLWG